MLKGLLLSAGLVAFSVAGPVSDNIIGARATRSAASTRPRTARAVKRCASTNDEPTFPGLYNEALRPQIHYSPAFGFMNDPNGMFYANGTYHLYFQYNPNGTVAGNQHWGHATSPDLYTWTNHQPAISPNENEGIFSGSAVVDLNNTSGFFNESIPAEDRIVAIYTLNTPTDQNQDIAYSSDGGYTFTKYEGNPVISLDTTQFRDPKVIWHQPTNAWVMVVMLPQQYQVVFYGSENLRNWTELSRFGPAGILGFQYEVPDLKELPIEGTDMTKWVLFVSVNPGMPLGGSADQYFIGDFDGKTFTPDSLETRLVDFGKDYYAANSWNNLPDGQAKGLAWASNWQYTNNAPTDPWRSAQSLPRDLSLVQYMANDETTLSVLKQLPVNMDSILGNTLYDNTSVTTNFTVDLTGDGAWEVYANFSFNPNSLSFIVESEDAQESIRFGYNTGIAFVDRKFATGGWENVFFVDKFSRAVIPQPSVGNTVDVLAVIDRGILETFFNGGIDVNTSIYFFGGGRKPARLRVVWGEGETVTANELRVVALKRTWDC